MKKYIKITKNCILINNEVEKSYMTNVECLRPDLNKYYRARTAVIMTKGFKELNKATDEYMDQLVSYINKGKGVFTVDLGSDFIYNYSKIMKYLKCEDVKKIKTNREFVYIYALYNLIFSNNVENIEALCNSVRANLFNDQYIKNFCTKSIY